MWAAVTAPCGPGMGFRTCASFVGAEATKPRPRVYRTGSRACPRCCCGQDGNAVRVVERVGWGVKLGTGPDEGDWGVDVRFSARGGGCVVL